MEIAPDFVLISITTMFKVKCNRNKTYLTLKNGINVNLDEGMTIRVYFMVAKRSLFQLLYQNITDWTNLAQYLE